MDKQCRKCSSTNLYMKNKGNNVGLYCAECGSWQKWLNKNEIEVFNHAHNNDSNKQIKDLIYLEMKLTNRIHEQIEEVLVGNNFNKTNLKSTLTKIINSSLN